MSQFLKGVNGRLIILNVPVQHTELLIQRGESVPSGRAAGELLRKRPPLDGRRSGGSAAAAGGHHDDPEPARFDDPAVDVEVTALEFLPAEPPESLRSNHRRQCPEMRRCSGEAAAGDRDLHCGEAVHRPSLRCVRVSKSALAQLVDNEIIGSFIDQQFLDPEDDRVLDELLSRPVAGGLTLGDLVPRDVLRDQLRHRRRVAALAD